MDNFNVPEVDWTALAARLEKLLRAHAVPLIPGSQLALLVNQALGEGRSFKEYFGENEMPRLRTFVERYVPSDVVRATDQRKGSDILFAVPHEASAVELAQDGRLWKSFVAIQPATQLVFNRTTGAVSVLSAGLPVPDDCAVVEPVHPQEHRQLRLDFCDDLARRGVALDGLREVAQEDTDRFYQRWLQGLRSRKPLDRDWGQFRNEHLLRLYERRLLRLGASPDRATQLKEELALDHEVARSPKKVADALLAAESASLAAPVRDNREKRARELLRLASERLSTEQLLTIHLPLSAILDLTALHTER